jgi:hypothetical protein
MFKHTIIKISSNHHHHHFPSNDDERVNVLNERKCMVQGHDRFKYINLMLVEKNKLSIPFDIFNVNISSLFLIIFQVYSFDGPFLQPRICTL